MNNSITFFVIILLTLIFGFRISLYAQSNFGVIGGINHSTLKISDKAPGAVIESVTAYTFGLLIGFNISELYSIVLQPRYIVKGENVKWNNPIVWDSAKNRFNYLELPIYFQAKLKYSNFNPFIFSGFNIGYLFSATTKITDNNEVLEVTITDDYNKLDIALDIGVGVEYKLNIKYTLSFDLRYSHGLIDIAQGGNDKFRGIQGLLGFIYQL